MYYCWLGLCFCLFWNWICVCTILSTNDGNKVTSWWLALVFLILGPIVSMWSWYGTIYNAAKYTSNLRYEPPPPYVSLPSRSYHTHSSYLTLPSLHPIIPHPPLSPPSSHLRYWWFFFNYSIHVLWCIWCCIAVPILTAYWSFAGWVTAFTALTDYPTPGIFYVTCACLWSCLTAYSFWCLKDAWFFFRGLGGIEQVKQDAAVAAFKQNMAQQALAQQGPPGTLPGAPPRR